MKHLITTLVTTIAILFICFLPTRVYAQELEVEGKIKVTNMPFDNDANMLVIRNVDGTLGRRNVASLPFGELTLPYFDSATLGGAAFHIHNIDIGAAYGLVGSKGVGAATLPPNRAGILGNGITAHGVMGNAETSFYSGLLGVSESETGYGVTGYAYGGGIGGFFYTTNAGIAALVTGTGNVGIGISDPEAKMHVTGNTLMELNSNTVTTQLHLKEVGDDFARLSFGNTIHNNAVWHIAGSAKDGASGNANSQLNFFFKNDQGFANHMSISGNGRVGIGTVTPDRRLEVETTNEHAIIGEVKYDGAQATIGNSVAIQVRAMYKGIDVDLTQDNLNNNRYGIYCESFLNNSSGNTTGSHWASSFYASGGRTGSNYSIFGREASTQADAGNWGVYCSGAGFITSMWTVSDRRVKQDISDLTSAIAKLKLLKPKSYTYNRADYQNMNLPEGDQMGFLAQDLEITFPSLIRRSESPEVTEEEAKDLDLNPSPAVLFKAVNQQPLIALLTKAIQEQQELIETQQNQLQKQNELIQQLVNRMDVVELQD